MFKKVISGIFLLVFCLFFIFPPKALASFSFNIQRINPTTVDSKSQEVEVVLSITELPSESFFRVGWQKEEGTTYFGYLKDNGENWVKVKPLSSEECSSYYKVTDTTRTEVRLVTKIGEEEDILGGSYLLRAHRFTTTCSSNTPSENSVAIEINLPTPTPTTTPEPTAAPTSPPPTATPTPKPPTATPKPPTPTIKPTLISSSSPTASEEGTILGESQSLGLTGTPTEEPAKKENKPFNFLPVIFIFLGVAFIGGSFYLYWRTRQVSEFPQS